MHEPYLDLRGDISTITEAQYAQFRCILEGCDPSVVGTHPQWSTWIMHISVDVAPCLRPSRLSVTFGEKQDALLLGKHECLLTFA
jgi:hypothetical protein